jgi:hypothetical protein
MKPAAEALKKYNVVIPKLFQIILNISEDKQLLLLKYAEDLLVKERRAFIRKTCSIPVSYATYDRVYSDTIKNISQKGVFIETQRPLFVGEELLLSFSIIVQVNRSGIGVEFKNMSPYVEEMLGTLISRMKEELD